MRYLKEYESLDTLLGDLGGLGLVKERAYIELYFLNIEKSKVNILLKINFPSLDTKKKIIFEDIAFALKKDDFNINYLNEVNIEEYYVGNFTAAYYSKWRKSRIRECIMEITHFRQISSRHDSKSNSFIYVKNVINSLIRDIRGLRTVVLYIDGTEKINEREI